MAKPVLKNTEIKSNVRSGIFEVDMSIDFSLLNKGIQDAQEALDAQVMADMTTRMPFVTGNFIDRTVAKSASVRGTGKVYAGAGPYGRFLYRGKTMVDPNTGSTWARFKTKKVLVSQYEGKTNAKEDLVFSHGVAEWFEVAKSEELANWVELVATKMIK